MKKIVFLGAIFVWIILSILRIIPTDIALGIPVVIIIALVRSWWGF